MKYTDYQFAYNRYRTSLSELNKTYQKLIGEFNHFLKAHSITKNNPFFAREVRSANYRQVIALQEELGFLKNQIKNLQRDYQHFLDNEVVNDDVVVVISHS